jgi:tRNA nucleotidyltransferase (CCA-adding enzyme)
MIKLPEFVEIIIDKITSAGFEAFAVGGCVRDTLLSKSPNDWDITTSATPYDIEKIFSTCYTVPTGLKHGTITVMIENTAVEVTTYRTDGVYTDSRHPESVTFTKSIEEDLSRRDFTINAMAYNQQNGLIDLFGGQRDLKSKTIRTVGNAETRFKEDALRIIRALRFASVLGFNIEESTSASLVACSHLLLNISKERIWDEFSKIITASYPSHILKEYIDVFSIILGINLNENKSGWQINIDCICRAENILPLRLALLFNDLTDIDATARLLKVMKADNKTIASVKILLKHIKTQLIPNPIHIKKIMSEIGSEHTLLLIKAHRAKFPEKTDYFDIINRTVNNILDEGQCFTISQLAINGNDIKNEFDHCGTEIGLALKLLLNAVIEEKCFNNKSDLLSYLKNQV